MANNKILQAAEANVEKQLVPEIKDDYLKIVVAGSKVAMQGGPDGMLAKLKQSADPVKSCAEGAVNLVMTMRGQSRGQMPVKALIPAATTLMLHALDFAGRTGIIKVDAALLDKATHIFTNRMFAALGITSEMLRKMGKRTHTVMQDPEQMETINRRAGTVKDPRASISSGIVKGA